MYQENYADDQGVNFLTNVVLELQALLDSTGEFDTVCQKFLEQLLGSFLVTRGAMLILDPGSVRLIVRARSGLDESLPDFQLDPETFEAMITIPDSHYSIDRPPPPLRHFFADSVEAIKALDADLWIPLRIKRSLLGIISLSKRFGDREYDHTDLRMLDILGRCLALAIYNHFLFSEVRAQGRGSTGPRSTPVSVQKISAALDAIRGEAAIEEEILHAAVSLCECPAGAFFLTRPHNPLLKAAFQEGLDPEAALSLTLSRNARWLSECFEKGQAVALNGVDERRLRKVFAGDSLLAAPIPVNGDIYGVIVLGETESSVPPRRYGRAEAEMLSLFTAQAGVLLANRAIREAAAALQEQHQTTLDSMLTPFFTLDVLGQVVSANAAFVELLGLQPEQFTDVAYQTLFPEDEHIVAVIQNSLMSGHITREYGIKCLRLGMESRVNLAVAPIRSPGSLSLGALISLEPLPADNDVRSMLRNRASANLIDDIADATASLATEADSHSIAVLCCRIENLAMLTASESPRALMATLGAFDERARRIIFEHGGVIIASDPGEITAAFGAVFHSATDVVSCLSAAGDLLRQPLIDGGTGDSAEAPGLRLIAGVGYGKAVVGHAGGTEPVLTVIGEPVQVARHLVYNGRAGELLASAPVIRRCGPDFRFEKLKKMRMKHWPGRIQAYKLLEGDEASLHRSDEPPADAPRAKTENDQDE